MRPFLLAALLALAAPASADDARVVAAEATRGPDGWRFSVTVESADTGWEKYADGWEVSTPEGTRLGYRALLHPHVDEQPFTRSLAGVAVPADADAVTIRAHDSETGWGPEFRLELDR
jgi:hypothetical protein